MNIIKRCRHGMMIFNDNDIWQGKSFEVYGEYSESEVIAFNRLINPGDTVLDVGANIGSFATVFSRLVGPNGVVISSEPERNCFYNLCGNIAVNDLLNVFPFQQAIGREVGVLKVPELSEDTTNYGGLDLSKDYSESKYYNVMMNTLDNMGIAKINFIKIDVEGMEEEVLRGGKKVIETLKPTIYLESDREEKRDSLLNYLDSIDYTTRYSHNAPFWNPHNFTGEKKNVFSDIVSFNYLCFHKDNELGFDPAEIGMQKAYKR